MKTKTLIVEASSMDEIRQYAEAVERAARKVTCNEHFTAPVRHFDAINRNLAQWAAQHPSVVAL